MVAPAAASSQQTKAAGARKKLISIRVLELVVALYDFVTLPIYYLIYKPWKTRALATRARARQVSPFTWTNVEADKNAAKLNQISTIDELFRESVTQYGPKNALGVRNILGVEYQKPEAAKSNGAKQIVNGETKDVPHQQTQPKQPPAKKLVSKLVLDDKYSWFTYKQVENIVKQLSAGLVSMCNDSLENLDGSRKVLIAGDTCMQWFCIAHACFRNNITLATTYTTLDDEAILYSIQQTEVKILVVSQKFARRLHKIIPETPIVDTIILLDEPLPGEENQAASLKSLLGTTSVRRVLTYEDLRARGKVTEEKILAKPTAQDIAVLMYTSGSTGKAKGVMLTQKNIVCTALSFVGPGEIHHADRYLGYLPLGHVLELSAECIFMRNGSTIAYSSPFTLTSKSPFIKEGAKGDADLIKPTIMGAVPLVLDRLKSAVKQAVKSSGPFFDQLVNEWLIDYKRYWWERYYETPILNYLICRKFNMILGGEVRAICAGGAALSCETHEYLRHVTNFTLLQGYGLTETFAAASFCDIHDRRYNVVGAPYPIVHIKLIDWSDYSVHDKPFPRGEIVVGGQSVTQGYYKMEDLTHECFFVDETTSVRYFKTGDIGMMLPDGVLKIIDRKKDLVKPLCGEYISLSEIECALDASNLVECVCVYCSQFSNYVVALVKPNQRELKSLAQQLYNEQSELGIKFRQSLESLTKTATTTTSSNSNSTNEGDGNSVTATSTIIDTLDFETLCNNSELTQKALSHIKEVGAERKLRKIQIPSNLKLASEEWTAESGFITASFKIRRRELEKFYANDIERLYAEIGESIKVSS